MGINIAKLEEYAEPLLNGCGDDPDKVEYALHLASICWNLSLKPEEEWEDILEIIRQGVHLNVHQFEDFKEDILFPMVQRRRDMFPRL